MDQNKIYDGTIDDSMEERSKVETIRENGRISKYNFTILNRKKPPLVGSFSREEVDLMFRLYSNEGAGLSQKVVATYFPLYTFQQFKKVLKAFNLTHSGSVPFAPHVVEEHTEDELVQLTIQMKENNFLKRYMLQKESINEQKYKETLKDNIDLRESIINFREFLQDIKFDFSFDIKKPKHTSEYSLIVYLSDMHIGADVSPYSIYDNNYDSNEVYSRMQRTVQKIFELTLLSKATKIIICNVGDSLDGYDGKTTRGGHSLPQNLNNKDQYKTFIGVMLELFKELSESGYYSNIKYIAVEGGNHEKYVKFC